MTRATASPRHGIARPEDGRRVGHRKPPLEGRQGPWLAHARRGGQDVVDVVGIWHPSEVVEDRREQQVGAPFDRHAACPTLVAGAGDGSGPIARRISPRARWSLDLTVPIGMPSVDATSLNGIPR